MSGTVRNNIPQVGFCENDPYDDPYHVPTQRCYEREKEWFVMSGLVKNDDVSVDKKYYSIRYISSLRTKKTIQNSFMEIFDDDFLILPESDIQGYHWEIADKENLYQIEVSKLCSCL